jgi:Zn-dependent protease with chaperone function
VAAPATFFEQQHLARRNTRVMVMLFLLAVVAVVIAVDLVLAGTYIWSMRVLPDNVPRSLYIWGALATAAAILVVSAFNVSRLADGGASVARMVGARRIAPDTRDALERRLINVVEEMAIASGVRVPGVYVMDEERGINAFAAGWDVSSAIVAVTRGTLEALTRDELQGVIGHEFSHILNGDMRLNLRMIGVLAGIVFIGSIGEFVMRTTRGSRKGSSGLFLAGLAVFIIGYVGLFFARLIKASVSRQREFLADASSVQFTRNPDGIAGALDQIRASGAGALISGRYAEELSHMYFGQGVRAWLGGLFDTHPPLDERIRRVNPRFQPSAYRSRRPAAQAPEPLTAQQAQGRRVADLGTQWGRSAADSARLVGTMDAGKVDYAARLLAALPAALRERLRDAETACAALVALLLAPKEEVRGEQIRAMQSAGLTALAANAGSLEPLTRPLGPQFHLPVVDLALPAIKAASAEAKRDLVAGLEAVIHADRRVSLHEFVILTLVGVQLAPKTRPSAAPSRKLSELRGPCLLLLLLIAHAGTRADASGQRQRELETAVRAGVREMGLELEGDLPAASGLSLASAGAALEAAKQLAPLQKAILIKGLFAAATANGTINIAEAELMRLMSAVLDCPLPPLLERLDPASL